MQEIIELADPATGDTARIALDLGFNCFSFRTVTRGKPVEVLWSHPNFLSGEQRPSGSGIPLLFPFVGRIQGTSFSYEGREYHLEAGDGQGNAIHGFVMQRPWQVIDRTETRAVGQFHAAIDAPELLKSWPADFRIMVAYELRGGALISQIEIDNPDERPLPFAFATHAYFRLPVGGSGDVGESAVTIPISRAWELAGLRPTGKVLALGDLGELPRGMRLGERQLDHVFTGIGFDGGMATTALVNPQTGRTLRQTFDDSFRHVVVFTPPHREAICMEPYTATPDMFRLEAEGIDTGLRLLGLGETYQTTIEIRFE